ncbi:MAG: zinc metalloprotease HtpX [Candidatus Woesearchaeota archaeon]
MINQLKTFMLLAALTALVLVIGSFFGTAGFILATIFVVLMNVGTYFFADKLVLRSYGAREVTKDDHPQLYEQVSRLAKKAHLPMPKVYIIPSATPNAFATGRNPHHSAVAFTQGILHLLDTDELDGVIAHELAHVKNRDILLATIAAGIAGIVSFLSNMALWQVILGGNRENASIVHLLLLAIVAPLMATVIQLAISRSREYLADQTAAKLTKNPHALASALQKLTQGVQARPLQAHESTASLFIVKPFAGGGFSNLFSTHPPIAKRIKRLEALRV